MAKRRSTEPRYCWLCGANGMGDPLEKHHIFGGANRKKSEKYGLVVDLCGNRCHRNGMESAHKSPVTRQMLREFGQKEWMKQTGGSVEDFIIEFGRNYI